MTLTEYKRRMAELGIERAALDTGIPEWSRASIRATKVSNWLPTWKGEKQN